MVNDSQKKPTNTARKNTRARMAKSRNAKKVPTRAAKDELLSKGKDAQDAISQAAKGLASKAQSSSRGLKNVVSNAGEALKERSFKEQAGSVLGKASNYLLHHRGVLAAVLVVAVLLVGSFIDGIANLDRAYGGVRIGGIDVGGMNREQMHSALEKEFGTRIDGTEIIVYSSEKTRRDADDPMARVSDEIAIDEDEDSIADLSKQRIWHVIPTDLAVYIPYDEEIEQALAVGRSDGGVLKRLSLIFGGCDIPVEAECYEPAFTYLADMMDIAIGDQRKDATIEIDGGEASALDGYDGQAIDRAALWQAISDGMISNSKRSEYVLDIISDPSRISNEQAQAVADALNRVLSAGAVFNYKGHSWRVYSYELGNWIRVGISQRESGDHQLALTLDEDYAVSRIIPSVDAYVDSNNMTVSMQNVNGDIKVSVQGSARVPEVGLAVKELEEALFGENGRLWSGDEGDDPIELSIRESDAPESMTFDEAVDLGILTVLGEYYTWYSTDEGAEPRNHNIHIAADLISGSIVKPGETWSFNETTGDSNDPNVFETAGSIVEGEYIDSVGGGICQVATTVFNAVYEAGLWIAMRANHTLYISSYPDGRDSTVSYPDLDMRWRNDLDSDVVLMMSYTDDTVTAKIYGVRTGYRVESETSDWKKGARYHTDFKEDPDLAPGYYYLKTKGADGGTITVTRTVYGADGDIVSKQEFVSKYDAKNEVYVVAPDVDKSKLERPDSDDD